MTPARSLGDLRRVPAAPFGQSRPVVAGKFLSRAGRPLRVRGVTYGPFAPDAAGDQFPAPERVRKDFALMQAAGINAVRAYHLPPDWLLEQASEAGMHVFIDVPWPKHLCFLDSAAAREQARRAVRHAALRGQRHPSVLAYSVGNEIPTGIVRWHGVRRVERFLAELRDVCKQADPDGLVTYASFPPTEYLDLTAFDFATFNVYLHDREAFRRYLLRLQNLVGDKPLILGEIGMDTLRHPETEQAAFLAGHVEEAALTGLAGTFVFAWTDDWHTGGHPIDDWAFGVTTRDRRPKAGYRALATAYSMPLAELLPAAPRVSVVVCTYNGGRTLAQCLTSLGELAYPDYEVIVVDDGSTDATPAIVARFPEVKSVRQPNLGLSVARNVGLAHATGDVVAYTDDDCFADPDWLTHLVYQLHRTGAAAVGGPNLTPEDGKLAACVAASPGQPTHVLESDQVAEHVPGCNMAFRREALLAINGFDPQYRKAGDDVDVCWRLQQAGHWITFAPGAFVWHHRRQNPRAYLKQQAGYGEAEGLLRFKHPDKFNRRGDGKWRGVLYGASLKGLRLDGAIIYRGTFATGLFQCVYQPGPAHWAMLPSTLEWHLLAGAVALGAVAWWPALLVAMGMLVLSVVVAGLQAVQARLPAEYDDVKARLLVAALCYAQPLVRSWARYRTRLLAYRPPTGDPDIGGQGQPLPVAGVHAREYWSERACDRTDLLRRVVGHLNAHRWGRVLDSGWSSWDVGVYCHPWTVVEVCTAQEEHGGDRSLVRVRFRLRPTDYVRALLAGGLLSGTAGAALVGWPAAVAGLALVGLCGGLWWRGTRRAAQVVAIVDHEARALGLIACGPEGRESHAGD